MRYQVLATDYDGTLAHNGLVDDATILALEKLRATGRRVILVTGRELPELLGTFSRIDLFEWVVAENGALLYHPATREHKALADAPSAAFLQRLHDRGVKPISVGQVIVATWTPHEKTVLQTIHELGLELQVIFNKSAVMILPAGINKATGLSAALHEMGLSPHNAVGVGDAENDHAMLRLCEVSVAVANALPSVKDTADLVTQADHGAGVAELIGKIISNDLHDVNDRLERHFLPLGTAAGQEIKLPAFGQCALICGPSASGKSTVATALLESMASRKYQFCVIDPEGDYETLESAVVLGGPKGPPAMEEFLKLLENPEQNIVLSLTGMPIADRPSFFVSLLPRLVQTRARTGRPHWLILDEAHHLMPAEWSSPANLPPEDWRNVLLITVHPSLLARPVIEQISTLMAVGPDVSATLRSFAEEAGIRAPAGSLPELQPGELLLWSHGSQPVVVRAHPTQTERRRHRRKYAEGELPPERSFYFQGPDDKLNIRAQNLMMFLQVSDGVDDETWDYHLKQGDFAKWFSECIKDESLAAEAKRIAGASEMKPAQTRALIRAAIERDYTLPASAHASAINAR